MRDMHSLIFEYERLRLNEFWDTVILARSKQGKWLGGFDSNGPTLLYFKSATMQRLAASSLQGKTLWGRLRSLPLYKQKALLESIKPSRVDELKQISNTPYYAVAPDFHSMLSDAGSSVAFVKKLCSHLRDGGEPLYHPLRYGEFLTMLLSKSLMLYPTGMRCWKSVKYQTLFNPIYSSKATLLLTLVTKKMARRSAPNYITVCNALASSNVATSQDLSPELISAYESTFVRQTEERFPKERDVEKWRSSRASARKGIIWLKQAYNKGNPQHPIVISRPQYTDSTSEQRLDGTFAWLREVRPDLAAWANNFRLYIAQSTDMRLYSPTGKLNVLGDFLCLLEDAPLSPWELMREHVLCPTDPDRLTFLKYLGERFPNENPKRKNDIISKARQFFDWLKDQLIAQGHKAAEHFANPIHANDNFGTRGTPSSTHRPRLDNYILSTMKEILTEDDFRFAKGLPHQYAQVLDSLTNTTANVWDPSMTVCLYVLLETPIRSHQARWLDSGELDQKVYDEATNTLIPNPSKLAIKGRKESALQLTSDSVNSETWMSLWVNTNKSAQYNSKDIGYPIPYMSSKLQELLVTQRSWQRRYLPPILRPIPYADYQRDVRERPRTAAYLPDISPLFRDARSPSQEKPISYDKLKAFYRQLLVETQKRIEEKYGRKVQLVRMNGKAVEWSVDLHTLRVSGITALIEAGVPLEIVSRFVAGHRTLVMTLHYLKYAPSKLRARLKAAYEQLEADVDFVNSPDFQHNLDDFAPYLLGQEGAGVGAGFIALQCASGLLTINAEGICPGTSCDNGGPLIAKSQDSHGPVPGGQRCGLCRFWITGPAHLHGQVAAVNNLAYKIRKKGLEIAELNDKRLDAEDRGNQREARSLNDKVELLSRELAIDVNEWFSRYRYAERSMELMNDYLASKRRITGKGRKLIALTSATPTELKVTLESAHEFALLDHITQMTDFTTGFRNNEAELEKRSVLSTLMMENGVRPFLLELTEQQAREAGNLLSSMILHQVEGQDLDEVMTGHRPLSDYPALSRAINIMANHVESGSVNAPLLSPKLSKLLNQIQSPNGASPEDVETFA
ncbi:integrase family protein [Paraburkholderia atlantica]|uniref:Integrase family protein n=2 Tax=Paraburkholderia atlantica TaxID=2654982 RepID=D5WBZ9_PARAM|nr:integrase family protein [Paraburkholderia atlantica]